MRVIVNADDFGRDEEGVRATIDCFADGALTSASVMANMPATDDAISFALAHPEFSFGAHLTFVGNGTELPVSDPAHVPSLVDESGRFLSSNRVRALALSGRLPIAHIEREMAAQLGRLRDGGLGLSHVDSHCHLHKFPPFTHALSRVLPRFNVYRVRTTQDLYVGSPYRSPTYWLSRRWRRRIRSRFTTTDHFFMARSVAEAQRANELVRRLRGQTTEAGFHPGLTASWRRAEAEAARAFSDAVREAGHQMIGWHDV